MRYCLIFIAWIIYADLSAQDDSMPALIHGHFSIERELVLPGTPEAVYDSMTGDISHWWNQKFSKQPYRLVLEPNPGGGFWEIFDASGDGVKHATVIYAHRGKMLRFDGPLGLSGRAVQYVTSYYFTPVDIDKTLLRVTVHIAGAYEPAVPEMVEQMWDKLLFKQLLPYLEKKE